MALGDTFAPLTDESQQKPQTGPVDNPLQSAIQTLKLRIPPRVSGGLGPLMGDRGSMMPPGGGDSPFDLEAFLNWILRNKQQQPGQPTEQPPSIPDPTLIPGNPAQPPTPTGTAQDPPSTPGLIHYPQLPPGPKKIEPY